jgi:Kef-type K+ transport system membrane component KefB
MEGLNSSYTSLLIIILLATFVPLVLKKLNRIAVPSVVGEILAGVIIGKSGLDIVHGGTELDFIYSFGFAFLMFLSGLEVDFSLLRNTQTDCKYRIIDKPIFVAIMIFLGTLIMSYGFAYLLVSYGMVKDQLLMTLILSTTSLGIVVPILKEKGIIGQRYGQTILMASLIADFATMVMITILIGVRTEGDSTSIFLVIILFIAFFLIYNLGKKYLDYDLINELANTTAQIKVRGSFVLILIFITLANAIGMEIILGAFLAGVIVSLLDDKEASDLYMKLDAIGFGFFVPIFFIMVGVSFDLKAVMGNPRIWIFVPILIIMLYLVKMIPSLLLARMYPLRKTIAAGFLLSSRLSLIIAASAVGLEMGLIKPDTNSAIILVALITCTFSPMIFNRMLPYECEDITKRVFIIGSGKGVEMLVKRLKEQTSYITVLVMNNRCVEDIPKCADKVEIGNPLSIEFLKSTDLSDADSVVIAIEDEGVSTEICRICKNYFSKNNLIILSSQGNKLKGETLYGAQRISPDLATAALAQSYINNPNTYNLLFTESDFGIIELELNNPDLFNTALSRITLPGNSLILSIKRGKDKIIPHGSNVIEQGDVLTIVGSKEYMEEVKTLIATHACII